MKKTLLILAMFELLCSQIILSQNKIQNDKEQVLMLAQNEQDIQNLQNQITQEEKKDSIINEHDFITASEYGKYLYENPRGISCKKCHGEFGEGEVIAKYNKNEKEIELKAPNIATLSKEKFELALINSKGVMPKYYLTKQEIDAIYRYITSHNLQNVD